LPLLAVVLAAVGVTGRVFDRGRENARSIRMALGSTASAVLRRVLLSGMVPVLPGLLAGLVGARAASQVLLTLVPNLRPSSPAVLLLLASFLSGVALLACYLPARKSSRVDPMAVLRLD
jgi:putative ABC transport system permease protein